MRIKKDLLKKNYGLFGDQLVKSFETFEKDSAADLQKLIRFCVSIEKIQKPRKKKLKGVSATGLENTQQVLDEAKLNGEPNRHLYLHLLILLRARTAETLPAANQLVYEAIHIYRRFDLLPTYKHLSLSSQAIVAAKVEEKIAQALISGEDPPFLDESWLGRLGLAYANNPFLNKKKELEENYCSELVELKYTGEQVGKKATHLPPKPFLREFCKQASLVLTLPNLRSKMLYQIPHKTDDESQEYFTSPLHIGWVKTGDFYNFSGVAQSDEERSNYGPTLMTQSLKNADMDLVYLFKVVPPEVSIPLLSISLFSILKFLFLDYPSRINLQKENYLSVLKKQEKVVFYTIHGVQAKELAHAFAGFFTDYGKGNTPENYILRQSRVHDGVVVLDDRFNNLDSFQRITMLRDACVLCTNVDFPKNKNEVAVFSNTAVTEEQLQRVGCIVRNLIHRFIIWLDQTYCQEFADFLKNCTVELVELFSEQYYKAADFLAFSEAGSKQRLEKFKEKNEVQTRLSSWTQVAKLKKTLEFAYFEQLEKASGIDPRHIAAYRRRWVVEFNPALDNIIKKWKAKYREVFLRVQFTQEMLGTKDRRYGNLFVAFSFFLAFLKDIGSDADTIARLESKATEVLVNLDKQNEIEVQPVAIIVDYITHLVNTGQFTLLRAKEYPGSCGWYNGRKNQFYLPYHSFFDDLCSYWKRKSGSAPFRYTKASFLAALAEKEVLIAKKNGNASSYIRTETKAVVSPVDAKEQKTETVIRLDINKLQFPEEVKTMLELYRKIDVPIRRKSSKTSSERKTPAE